MEMKQVPACPVMGFMVDQATRETPVALVGTTGLIHLSVFNRQEADTDSVAEDWEWLERKNIPTFSKISARR